MENQSIEMPQLMDEKELAELLGVQPRTLSQWRYHGRGPSFIRISGRCVRYMRSDVMEFLQENYNEISE